MSNLTNTEEMLDLGEQVDFAQIELVLIAVIAEKKIALRRHKKTDVYEIIGGQSMKGEDFKQTLIRECCTERKALWLKTSINRSTKKDLLQIQTVSRRDETHEKEYRLKNVLLVREKTIPTDSLQDEKIIWVNEDEIENYKTSEITKVVIGVLKADRIL